MDASAFTVVAALVAIYASLRAWSVLRLFLLAVLSGVAPAFHAPDFLYAFVGAAAVSAVLTVLAARLSDAGFDPDRLSRGIRRLDAPSGGTGADD